MKTTVSFHRMDDGTAEDYALLDRLERQHVARLPDAILAALMRLEHSWVGYPITRLEHSLQAATRALRDKADEELIVAALIHDLGDELAPYNHAEIAASILRPYVRPEVTWIVQQHALFQTYYYAHHQGGDRNARERFRDHPWYQACVEFCANWDQCSFDPHYVSEPMSTFEPMLRRIFSRPAQDLRLVGPLSTSHAAAFERSEVRQLRRDLALALRAADHHALSEGVCNHFSVMLPDGSGRFLISPRGLHWSEIGEQDIVMVDSQGNVLAGRREVEATAMYIHAAVHRIAGKHCVLHTHMPYATALTVTQARALDTTLSQNAMRFHGRMAIDGHYNGVALDADEGERIALAMKGADVAFLANHGVIVCGETVAYAYDDLYYLERACMVQMIAAASGLPLAPVDAELAALVAAQSSEARLQSTLFFESLRRRLPEAQPS